MRAGEVADLGEKDARYIRRIYAAVRWTAFAGRGLIYAGIFIPWLWVAGVLLLGLSKILDNVGITDNRVKSEINLAMTCWGFVNATALALTVPRMRRRTAYMVRILRLTSAGPC